MISIVLPIYNAENYLGECIESILNQKYVKFELIALNDGSTDSSLEIIRSYVDKRIRIVDRENKGLSYSLNEGIQLAKYNLIARMDSDDIMLPGRLEKQFLEFQNDSSLVLLGSYANEIDEKGEFVCLRKVKLTDEEIRNNQPYSSFIHPSVMFRKDAANRTNLYPLEINRGEDSVFFYNLSKHGKVRNLAIPLINYRIHRNALSDRSKNNQIIIDSIVESICKKGYVSEETLKRFHSLDKPSQKDKIYNYYRYLSIKYAGENKNLLKFFYNISKVIKAKPRSLGLTMVLIAVLIIPKSIILKLQTILNSRK